MMRTFRYAESTGSVSCSLPDGRSLDLPVVNGILKHPSERTLPGLLTDPEIARKYTIAALRKASWKILRHFPTWWLIECLDTAELPPGRLNALRFMLSAPGEPE
jgi:hypothetical protein